MNDSQEHGYERSDAAPKPLLIFAIGLALLVGATLLAASFLTALWNDSVHEGAVEHPMAPLRVGPTEPLLQSHPTRELTEHRVVEQTQLGRYGWIDSENDIVHIPIGVAMKTLLERGLPVRSERPIQSGAPAVPDEGGEEGR